MCVSKLSTRRKLLIVLKIDFVNDANGILCSSKAMQKACPYLLLFN